jgi:hypothetical protein
MRGDESLALWLYGYKLDALERVLTESGKNTQTVMQARLEELYRQYVPVRDRIQINERIEGERLAAEQRAEESRRVSAFHVTGNGADMYFKTDRGYELLETARRLRLYLRKDFITDSYAESYAGCKQITADEFDALVGERMDNTGKVVGAFDIDFDKREFSAVNIMDGWQTFAMGDVSAAAYYACRGDRLTTEQRWTRLLEKLDGKEITSAGHLSARNFSFSDEIIENDEKLNFYINTNFDADAVFGTHVCTDENDDYINLYADYDMETGRVCDTLSIILWKGDGQTEEMSYTLNAAEKEVLLRAMDTYCQKQTGGMDLAVYSARCMAGQQAPLTEPTM